jgi:hypothetical protein
MSSVPPRGSGWVVHSEIDIATIQAVICLNAIEPTRYRDVVLNSCHTRSAAVSDAICFGARCHRLSESFQGGFSPQRPAIFQQLLHLLARTIVESFLSGEARATERVFVLAGAAVRESESIFRVPIRLRPWSEGSQ